MTICRQKRRLLQLGLALPLLKTPLVMARADELTELTPSCGEDDLPTQPQTAGPFYTPESPLKWDFTADDPDGESLNLSGFVMNQDCQPLSDAVVELWHADHQGRYDNRGFRLRGHQITDEKGRYRFRTILPGLYPGRTRHFHVRVTSQFGPKLTTQLYFPGESVNKRDYFYQSSLELTFHPENTEFAQFDFVLPKV